MVYAGRSGRPARSGTGAPVVDALPGPLLDRLIEQASETNMDLLTAVARIEEIRAWLGISAGQRYSSVDAFGGVVRQRSSENVVGMGYGKTFYSPGIGASWEIELFDRIRRSVEASTTEYQASEGVRKRLGFGRQPSIREIV